MMPILTPPKLPSISPGKPLDAVQRRELVALQQRIKVQIMQQRVLVESIGQLPHFRPSTSSSSQRGMPNATDEALANQSACAWEHVVGPDPVGDTPADDPEGCEEQRNFTQSTIDECNDNSTLGTLTKVYVDFGKNLSPVAAIEANPFARVDWDGMLGRGGISGKETGEPSLLEASMFPTATGTEAPGDAEKAREENNSKSPRRPPASQQASHVPSSAGRIVAGGFAKQPQTPDSPVMARRPVPSSPPQRDQGGQNFNPADANNMGATPPGREERRWIEAAVRRMFRSLCPDALESIIEAFREWKLPACVAIVKQQSPITTGRGLYVLFEGVVDVLHRPKGGSDDEKVCTYDRCGQCFGELELFYDVPRAAGAGRKLHWATIATRTPVTLWTIDRDVLRGTLPGAQSTDGIACDKV